jgi:hypothetical protein
MFLPDIAQVHGALPILRRRVVQTPSVARNARNVGILPAARSVSGQVDARTR